MAKSKIQRRISKKSILSIALFGSHQKKWSEKTFGDAWHRGFKGPLKHLKKEIKEIKKNPSDIEEWADALFLLLDGLWRAGFSVRELMIAAWKKLEKNKKREWPPISEQDPNGATEHIRGTHD